MNKHLIVTASATEEISFARAVHINSAREKVLDELMDRCHDATGTYPAALEMASNECQTANELAYVSFHLGAFAESQRTKHELMTKLLGE